MEGKSGVSWHSSRGWARLRSQYVRLIIKYLSVRLPVRIPLGSAGWQLNLEVRTLTFTALKTHIATVRIDHGSG